MIRLADYVINSIYSAGASYIYMVSGRGVLYLTDAVARHEKITGVCVHHEQAASYAAYGYAKKSEKIGACLVSTGCASTNAITGVLCAWQNDVPCIFISGQNNLKETTRFTKLPIRTYGSQEADIVSLVEPITKYAVMITDPSDIGYEIDKAIYIATHGRKGPVWIDIPIDLQNARIDETNLRHFTEEESIKTAGAEDIEFVKNKLQNSHRPVLLIGNGVRISDAIPDLKAFLEKHDIPLVYSPSAVDIVGAGEYQYSMGAIGSLGGSRAANFTIQNADYVLAIGSRLSTVLVGQPYEGFAREAEINVVDIDPYEHKKDIIRIEKFIEGDAKQFLQALNKVSWESNINSWLEKCSHWKEIFPMCDEKYKSSERVDLHFLSDCLSEVLPDGAAVITDAGFEELIIPASIKFRGSQRCIHPAEQGTMGFALPGAIGVYNAGEDIVVSVNGDGSIMMNLQELQTISFNRLPIKILVCNNNCYAVIRKRQQDLFRKRTIGTDSANGVSCPEFEKVAGAFDIPYMHITSSSELMSGLKAVLDTEGPVICEIDCVEEQEYLHNSYYMDENHKLVRTSLENQSPFLDRKILEKEMLISD